MKVYKMPKNYMKCECGCEFEFECGDIITIYYTPKTRSITGESEGDFIQIVDCPYCQKSIDITKAIENTQSQENNSNALNEKEAILLLKIEQLQQLLIANINYIADKKEADKLRKFIKETDDNLAQSLDNR